MKKGDNRCVLFEAAAFVEIYCVGGNRKLIDTQQLAA